MITSADKIWIPGFYWTWFAGSFPWRARNGTAFVNKIKMQFGAFQWHLSAGAIIRFINYCNLLQFFMNYVFVWKRCLNTLHNCDVSAQVLYEYTYCRAYSQQHVDHCSFFRIQTELHTIGSCWWSVRRSITIVLDMYYFSAEKRNNIKVMQPCFIFKSPRRSGRNDSKTSVSFLSFHIHLFKIGTLIGLALDLRTRWV